MSVPRHPALQVKSKQKWQLAATSVFRHEVEKTLRDSGFGGDADQFIEETESCRDSLFHLTEIAARYVTTIGRTPKPPNENSTEGTSAKDLDRMVLQSQTKRGHIAKPITDEPPEDEPPEDEPPPPDSEFPASPAGLKEGVQARMPMTADDFETSTAEWVRDCGVHASRTPKGPDGGLDIVGPDFAGQCKFHPSRKIDSTDVQQFYGAAEQAEKPNRAFFHYGPGYSDNAIQAAQALGIELWDLDPKQKKYRRVA